MEFGNDDFETTDLGKDDSVESESDEEPLRKRVVEKTPVKKRRKKVFFCCKCSGKFGDLHQREVHFKESHADVYRDLNIKYSKAHKFECSFCFRKFMRKASLTKHFEDKTFVEPKVEYKSVGKVSVGSKNDPKVCPVCGRMFSDKYQLALHESRVHATVKPFKCTFTGCTMAFALERLLKRHFKNVHEEKRMICDFCAKLFRTRKDLQQHLYVHMENKPLQCPICPKTFTLARVMKAHILASHSGIEKYAFASKFGFKIIIDAFFFRPFQCDSCEKAYKWKEDLRAHRMVEHLGIFPFKCRFCSKGYSGSSNRNWHEKRCPNNPALETSTTVMLQPQPPPAQTALPPLTTYHPASSVIQYNQF